MKIEAKDSFFESVEKLVWYDTNLWKVWSAIRYDIPLFFKNIWRFRKELYNHHPTYASITPMLCASFVL